MADVAPERTTLVAADGVELEAELAPAAGATRAGMVLCHPHPQYGGTMRSIVISALFRALPPLGVRCLRFNFRGVEDSGGVFDNGTGERLDAHAAVAALAPTLPDDAPLVIAGWSFGADVAISVDDPAIGAWIAIALPLHFATLGAVPGDPRPKLIVLAEHDEVREPTAVAATVSTWAATEVEVVPGASHFFVGRTDRLVELAAAFIDRVV